ncbi:MAG: efflux RND transporter periplasmic adaptor subunit [Labilithrix sp.]|nr:efflux RND transporter periplasmic adaptor subunit [Labilithrix sp.]
MRNATATEDVARTIGSKRTVSGRWARRAAGLALSAVVVALAGRAALKHARADDAPRYVTAEIVRGDLRVTVTATGTLAALGAVEVGSEVSGRVQAVYVDYNEPVKKGQVLTEIDPMQLQAEATQAAAQLKVNQAAVATAEATLVEAKQALDRTATEVDRGLVAPKQLEAAEAAHARAIAAVASAKASAALSAAAVSSSSWKLSRTKIVSPIDGVVLSRSVEPGQTVAASFQTPVLFKLATDLTSLELKVDVDESDVGRVSEGLTAEFRVDAYPDRVFTSKVRSVRNEAKTTSNVVSYEAILTVDNAERLLRPGMTATATITSELHEDVLLVPNAALRFQPTIRAGGGPPGAPPGPQVVAEPPLPKGRRRLYVPGGSGPSPASVVAATGATDGTHTELRETTLAPGSLVIVDVEEPQ